MLRVIRPIINNWHLKLAAVIAAALMYGGLVLTQNSRTFAGSVPVESLGQPVDVIVLSDLGAVHTIRYFAPADLGLRLDSSSFRATVDLADVDPALGPASVAIHVVAVDPRIQVLEYEPSRIIVRLESVESRRVPVRVVLGSVPTGLEVGEPVLEAEEALVTGPSSVVARVVEVQARVAVDPSGIDVNRQVELLAVDAVGEPLSPVDVVPGSIQVRLPIFTDRQTRSLPVGPFVVGTPAAGFEIAGLVVEPAVVTVEGDADDLVALERADTLPISVSGASSDITVSVALALPTGVTALGSDEVSVTVRLRPVTATRTFEAGLQLSGSASELGYALSTDRVLVTIGGSIADLDRLSGATLVLILEVDGLGPGIHDLVPRAELQTGLTVVSLAPGSVVVTITGPAPSPTASPGT
jgi:YbbR domain-containing protein